MHYLLLSLLDCFFHQKLSSLCFLLGYGHQLNLITWNQVQHQTNGQTPKAFSIPTTLSSPTCLASIAAVYSRPKLKSVWKINSKTTLIFSLIQANDFQVKTILDMFNIFICHLLNVFTHKWWIIISYCRLWQRHVCKQNCQSYIWTNQTSRVYSILLCIINITKTITIIVITMMITMICTWITVLVHPMIESQHNYCFELWVRNKSRYHALNKQRKQFILTIETSSRIMWKSFALSVSCLLINKLTCNIKIQLCT